MKLATFMMPLHPPGRNPAETLAEDREAILLADRLGFSEAFVGEHVTDLAENVTSCLMFLASVAHETKAIVLGSGTVNMPNSHPAAIAAGWLFGMLTVPLPSTMFFVSYARLARNIRQEVTFSARSVTCSPT